MSSATKALRARAKITSHFRIFPVLGGQIPFWSLLVRFSTLQKILCTKWSQFLPVGRALLASTFWNSGS